MRHWKSLYTSITTLGARVSVTLGVLVINGVAARRMTHDQFGLWTILYSVNLLTNALDFGFCFTLGNRLSALSARGAEAEEERRETFFSVMYLQLAITAVCILVVYLVLPFAPWPYWFKVTDPGLVSQVQPQLPLLLSLMISTLPVTLIWTVFFAYQEIRLASFLSAGGTVLQTTVFVVAVTHCGFMQTLLIYFSAALLMGLIFTGYIIKRRQWKMTLVPLRRALEILGTMHRVSIHAFFLTLSSITSQILGTLISGHVSGLRAAGDFALVQRLFSFLATSHLAILAPFSPTITRDSQTGNWDGIKKRLRICVLRIWPAVFLVLGPIIWYAHPMVIRLWAGDSLRLYPLATLLLTWACLNGFVNTFSVFLNSLGLVKMQAAFSFSMILPSLLLPFLLSRWLGVNGIALSMVICSSVAAVAWPLYTRRALRLKLHRV